MLFCNIGSNIPCTPHLFVRIKSVCSSRDGVKQIWTQNVESKSSVNLYEEVQLILLYFFAACAEQSVWGFGFASVQWVLNALQGLSLLLGFLLQTQQMIVFSVYMRMQLRELFVLFYEWIKFLFFVVVLFQTYKLNHGTQVYMFLSFILGLQGSNIICREVLS